MTNDEDPAEADAPFLSTFLKERLPELGLDYVTYGSYVLGVETDNFDNEPDEEVNEVVQLLQASSETHSDNQEVWDELASRITEMMKLDARQKQIKQKEEVEMQQQKLEKNLAQAKLEQAEKLAEPSSAAVDSKKGYVDEEAKRALVQRFGYENDGDEPGDEDGEEVQSNRQAAAAVNLEKSRELRTKKVQTKKEEQIKTKEHRMTKEKLKEERQKKAQKGERKR
jgi:hypothetical protein